MGELAAYFDDGLMVEPPIPRRTFLREAMAQGIPITEHPGARSAPEVAEAFEALAERVTSHGR